MRTSAACRVVAFLTLTLLLSGCVRFEGDLTVGTDDRVSGTIVFAYRIPPSSTGEPLNPGPEDVREDLRDKIRIVPYREDGYEGVRLTLIGLTFDELDRAFRDSADSAATTRLPSWPGLPGTPRPSGGPTGVPAPEDAPMTSLSLRRDGDQLFLLGNFFFPALPGLGGPPAEEGFEARVRVTFPGEVLSTNGERDGRTVSWTLRPATVEVMEASARADRSSGLAGWPVWTGVAAVLLLLLVAGAVLLRRRRPPAAAAPVPAWSAPGTDDRLWARPTPGEHPGLGTAPPPP